MKITFIVPNFMMNGGHRVVATYAIGLSRRGHQVTVISQPYTPPGPRARLKDLARLKWRQPPSSAAPLLRGSGVTHIVLDRPRPVVAEDVPDGDVVIATWWETAYWVAALPPEKGRGFYLVQGHEVHPYLYWQLAHGSYFLPLKKIAVSGWIADIMRELYGDKGVALVPNSVDSRLFHARQRRKNATPTVGFYYAPASFKGTDVAIHALERLRNSYPALRIVSFGSESPTPTLPLPKGTEYHRNPPQERIRVVYASCDAWIFSSRKEGFGLPILEAMACGTPVVATRAGAAPDLVMDGVNGYLVDIEDAEALADRVGRMIDTSEHDWAALSAAARATADGYTWEDALNRFEALLKESLDPGSMTRMR